MTQTTTKEPKKTDIILAKTGYWDVSDAKTRAAITEVEKAQQTKADFNRLHEKQIASAIL